MEYGTPRPKGGVHHTSTHISTMVGEPFGPWTFTQTAAASAAESKRKRFPTSRTEYRMNNKHVAKAFDEVQAKIRQCQQDGSATTITMDDFKLLKDAICDFRVGIIVHDSMTLSDLKTMQVKCAAELVEHTAKIQALAASPCPSELITIDAKIELMTIQNDKNNDLVNWKTTLSAEIYRLTYESGGNRVPSQHVQLASSTGIELRNILSPLTIRRRFISLDALTKAIRGDLVVFLTCPSRNKDRLTIVEQIKKQIIAHTNKESVAFVSAPH